ncbi:LVIS_2131 family protein [Bombilactobacillus thymidiniphilus]|uniref:LVIS_2131 family protein n=1 Tax=Bombilactobacillus thymidiniphilus TaxID=2923363 RepID=A0ABY4PEP6_9LACO|nr:LVIS_2131 family protein [Bombilactobacillus thymidiniphilus]UQS84143.1 LVIS_2131 family protein [Bombilactobacillus thymidiniphilus]
MAFNWNWLGIVVWLLVVLIVIGLILDVRRRHLKRIMSQKEQPTLGNVFLDIAEFLVALAVVLGMFYVTFLDHVDVKDTNQIRLSYEVKPLVMQTQATQGFYVQARESKDKDMVQYYKYWTEGAKYSVPGNNASISESTQPTTLNAKNYPWPDTKKYDKKYQKAYVITMVARYRNNWRNGLGINAGSVATDYTLIRVPSDTFVKIVK